VFLHFEENHQDTMFALMRDSPKALKKLREDFKNNPKSIEGTHPLFLDVSFMTQLEMMNYLKCFDLINRSLNLFSDRIADLNSSVVLPESEVF
jgi:hypothetical protein